MDTSPRNRWLALVYAATIFTSAFLLFQIQPMISKAILPWFGGTPAVWTICLLFFQSILFAGYAYAHFTNHWFRPGQQAMLHIVMITAALAFIAWLRVVPDATFQPHGDADPTRAILTILAITIGLPYLVLSATGPLLQAWFARSFPGRSPYRLYALSNVGSLLALLSYPFLFEREFDLKQQAGLWSVGFIAFAILCAYAAWRVRTIEPLTSGESLSRGRGQGDGAFNTALLAEPEVEGVMPNDASAVDPTEPSAGHFLMWLILPAFASIVLMATTNHISTDVAVVPMLWIVPLALYLLTFIIAFDRPNWYFPTFIAILTLIAIYPTCALYKNNNVGTIKLYNLGMTGKCIKLVADLVHETPITENDESPGDGPKVKIGFRTALFVNFATMFGICLLCHGQLARLKPHTRYLTAYYLMMSAGGALGGIAVSLVAPHVFRTIVEWNIAIFIAAVSAAGIILSSAVTRAVSQGIQAGDATASQPPSLWPRYLVVLLLVPFAFMFLDLTEFLFSRHKGAVYESRNFFGALTIREIVDDENPINNELNLLNGTTLHGTQFTSPELRGMPTSYYATTSGIGIVLNYFYANRPPGGVRIGDVGLGAGTLAAYAKKFDTIVFYEINPTVIDISTSGKWFTYIADCKTRGAHCDIKLGDARLTLQREVEQGGQLPYHVLVLDAFSGDAVPTHLLTAEAMDIYLPRIATEANMGVDGALLIHVSNRYLDLDRVARGAAEHIGFTALDIHNQNDDRKSINSSDWVVLTKNKDLITKLRPSAEKPSPDAKSPVLWTDAHSSLFEILR